MDRPDFFPIAREIVTPPAPRPSAVEEDRRIKRLTEAEILKLMERRKCPR